MQLIRELEENELKNNSLHPLNSDIFAILQGTAHDLQFANKNTDELPFPLRELNILPAGDDKLIVTFSQRF